MSTIRHIFILLAGILIVECCLTGDADSAVTSRDAALIRKTSDQGIFAIRSGELALQKADTAGVYILDGDSLDIRYLGKQLIRDHSMAHVDVRELAYLKKIDLRQTLTLSTQRKLDSLSKLHGSAFNIAYLDMMVESHRETLDLLQSRMDQIRDEELKIWVSSMLPRLENQVAMARTMRESVATPD